MSYELACEPVTDAPRLAEHFGGAQLELRELAWGPLFEVTMAVRRSGVFPGQPVLAASLHVNGKPIGLEALEALPGKHLALELTRLMGRALELNKADEGPDGGDDPAQARAAVNDEDGPPGEASTRSA